GMDLCLDANRLGSLGGDTRHRPRADEPPRSLTNMNGPSMACLRSNGRPALIFSGHADILNRRRATSRSGFQPRLPAAVNSRFTSWPEIILLRRQMPSQ